jgi:hypothetical protein
MTFNFQIFLGDFCSSSLRHCPKRQGREVKLQKDEEKRERKSDRIYG